MNALVKAFTSAEFHRMAAKGAFGDMRVELRRGKIIKMSPQHIPHARVKSDIQHRLERGVSAAGLGWEVLTETTVSFGGGFEPMPDIVVFDPTLAPASGPIPGAAVKLIVEVADATLADDLGEKREDYARAGLAEYWVADVAKKRVHRHADPQGDRYVSGDEVVSGNSIAMLSKSSVVCV